ncbi:NYN domain-containing protein [Helicobacter pylori]|uniref:NYN domain-containing protein n=1 Tax=Helicobacter pylori TaxID=210 RepID=UPI003569946A
MKKENKIAVFFDCENVSAEHIGFVFNKLQNYGEVIIRQSFRDWEQESTKPWDRKLHEKFAIEPIQVFSKTRKNSCDLRIVRAILEAINEKQIDTIALVSSDSDFRDLVIAVKSKGFYIIGFGESKTSDWMRNAYTTFIKLEQQRIIQDEQSLEIIEIIKNTIETNKQDNGYMLVSNLGSLLDKNGYTAKNFKSNSWGEFLKEHDDIFETKSISKKDDGIKDTLVVKIK